MKMKKISAIILALVMILSLCCCGRAKSSGSAYMPMAEPAATFSPSYMNGSGLVASEYAADMEMYSVPEEESSKATAGTASDDSKEMPEKIIYTSDVTVESTDFDASVDGLMKLIDEYKGFIESSSVNNANYSTISSGKNFNRSANYTIRVPAESFNAIMSSFSTLGNVPSSNIYTENVTAQYYDTQARLNNYSAQEQRLVELLEKAQTVSDIIEIENELTEVRYRIESLQTSLNSMDRKSSYSTIYLNLREVREYTPDEKVGFGRQLAIALENGLETLKDFVLGLVEALPVLIIVILIIIGLIKLFKWVFKGRKGKKAEKKNRKIKNIKPEDAEPVEIKTETEKADI